MVMERVAPGPVDQTDVGIGLALAVEIIGLAGVAQHVGDARHRDHLVHRIGALRQRHAAHPAKAVPDAANGTVAVAHAAARQADLPQHRRQHRRHPVGLLAMLAPLQRPCHGNHRAGGRHAPGQRADRLWRRSAKRRGPFRRLGLAVAFAHQIGAEALEPRGVAVKEGVIRQTLVFEHIGQRQHQGGVRARRHRQPVAALGGVAALRANVEAVHAPGKKASDPAVGAMLGHPAHADLAVLGVDASEHDEGFGLGLQRLPVFLMLIEMRDEIAAEDMRHDRLRAARGIAPERGDIAADAVEKAVHLALRMMEAPRRGPAVGAAEDRRVAMRVAHPVDLGRGDVERLVPRQLDEGLAAAPAALAPLEPALADRGPRHPAAVMHGGGNRLRNLGRIGIGLEGPRGDDAIALHVELERPPMARGHPCAAVAIGHVPDSLLSDAREAPWLAATRWRIFCAPAAERKGMPRRRGQASGL